MISKLDDFIEAYGKGFSYAYDNNIMLNWYPQRLMELCSRKEKLLELGIGQGLPTNRFSQYFAEHVVIDGSPSAINKLQKQYPDCSAKIVKSYFEQFESNSKFDLVVMGFVLEHVENPQVIPRHFKELLSPGRRCFVLAPNGESLHRRVGHAAGLLRSCGVVLRRARLGVDYSSAGYDIGRPQREMAIPGLNPYYSENLSNGTSVGGKISAL